MQSKQFGFNLSETRQFGKMMGREIIVRAKLPTNMFSQFCGENVDTSIFRHGTLTVYGKKHDILNQAISGMIKFMK